MAKKFLTSIDLNKNQALNLVLQNLAAHPSGPVAGFIYWNTTEATAYVYTGSAWLNIGGDITDVQGTAPIQVSISPTGVATISILAATSSNAGSMSATDKAKLDDSTDANTASTLVKRDASGNFSAGQITANKVTGLATPTGSTDAVNKSYVDGLIDSSLKAPEAYDPTATSLYPTTYNGNAIQKGDSFRITVAGTMSGTTVNVGDLLIALVDTPAQTTGNWTVAESNRDQATEAILGVAKVASQVTMDAGTNDTDFATPLKVKTYLTNTGYAKKVSFTGVSVGTTPGPQVLTHNLNTRQIQVAVYDETTFELLETYVEATSVNTVTIDANGTTTTVYVVVIG